MNRFRLARYEAGYSLAEAAAHAGVALGTVRRAEMTRADAQLTAPIVKALADAYGKSVAWLLDVEDVTA